MRVSITSDESCDGIAGQGGQASHGDTLACVFPGCDRQRRGKKKYCASHNRQMLIKGEASEFASRRWTYAEEMVVRDWYEKTPPDRQCNLESLAAILKRTIPSISRKAGEFGLTSKIRRRKPANEKKQRTPKYKTREERAKAISGRTKAAIAKNGHPRGMLGKKHTDVTKIVIGLASSAIAKTKTKAQRSEAGHKAVRTRVANGNCSSPKTARGSWRSGWREIGGKRIYFRSAWEANYARFLELEKARGVISGWEHEPETFWFEKIKRGVRSYLPDFRVTKSDGSIEYHEVKGWIDDKSKTKIKRMRIYHPGVKLVVISTPIYKGIEKLMKTSIEGWE